MTKFFILILCFFTVLIASAQTVIPNGTMETWINTPVGTTSYDEPSPSTFWTTANKLGTIFPIAPTLTTFKTTDAHSGTYAARMETKLFGTLLIPGLLNSGFFNSALGLNALTQGQPFTGRPVTFKGWFKYTSVNNDSAAIFCLLYKWNAALSKRDTIAIAAQTSLVTVSSYTQFSIPLNYVSAATPDSINLVFTSSAGGANLQGQVGSTLYIDDIVMDYTAIGTNNIALSTQSISAIPNPATSNIIFGKNFTNAQLSVYNLSGQLVHNIQLNAQNYNCSALPNGFYFVIINDEKNNRYTTSFQKL